jgi:DNA-directed RNA polymerase specialized sigma24 family protein
LFDHVASMSNSAMRIVSGRVSISRTLPADEEIQRRLVDAIGQLNPGAVEILMLRYVHNCSDAEIAKMLGTSRGTIAVSLYRSRARIRKHMRASSGEKS